jgi:hypothetical protein
MERFKDMQTNSRNSTAGAKGSRDPLQALPPDLFPGLLPTPVALPRSDQEVS